MCLGMQNTKKWICHLQKMTLNIFTIVLDGMPTIPSIFTSLNALNVDWKWTICEGVAANVNDTSWCQKIEPRLSKDGTTEFLDSISNHPRITILKRELWEHGKTQQCNAALETFNSSGILMQMDCDEIWRTDSLERVIALFRDNPTANIVQFYCRYFLGPNIISVKPNTYGNNSYEWFRAWRFEPGDRFISHEPPILQMPGRQNICISRDAHNITFDHYAYAYEKQLQFKEEYYGYANAVNEWKQLQQQSSFPIKLKDHLKWIQDDAEALRI